MNIANIKIPRVNIPNALTLFRLAILPVLVLFLLIPHVVAAWMAFFLFILGAFTDWLDGWYARKFKQVTPFGTFMDPISDKIYVSVVLLSLVATSRVDLWGFIFVVLIFVREFTISGLREFLAPINVQVPVSKLAKWKTATQMIATGVLIVAPIYPNGMAIGVTVLGLATLLTLVTAWDYLKAGAKHLKTPKAAAAKKPAAKASAPKKKSKKKK